MRFPLALLCALLVASSLQAADAKRPNLLFCFADDWGRYASAYAAVDGRPGPNDVVRTPNIDAVAKRGVLFRNAFVNAPSCTPCRSSLLTGRYFFRCNRGAILEGAVWDESLPTFPLLLRDAGYRIGKAGKVWSPGKPVDQPIGGQQYAYEKAGLAYHKFSDHATASVKAGLTVEAAKEKLLAQVRENFRSFLGAAEADKPWFFFFGPTNTHRTWAAGSGKALWGIDPDSLKGKMPGFLPDTPEVREDFADYLGEAQAYDAMVGVLMQQLKDAGLLENTVVMISGDHGAGGFPHCKCNLYDSGTGVALIAAGPEVPAGRVVDDLVSMIDLTPTFLELGGAPLPAGIDARSFVPLLHSEKSGQIDPARQWVITGRERHVGTARAGNLPYPQRALRTRDFLYIRNFAPERWPMGDPGAVTADSAPSAEVLSFNTLAGFADLDAGPMKAWLVEHRNDPQWKGAYESAFLPRPAEELYDLRRDPDQLHNLAADPSFKTAREALGAQLMEILKKSGDPRVAEGPVIFEAPPFAGAPQR
ncbi:MAG TPA: sulfatase [Chthoniobacteraceae bacterium]|jgi:arylsulfatase A-like enzyme|nr:sulfatase [Chthoniobacteraceae bacterium]